jgi:hypothetical protein
MLKKLKKIREISELQAKARGNSFENVLAKQIGVDLIASLIAKAFKLEKVQEVTAKEKATAKKILKEKYGIDVKKQDDEYYSAGLPDKKRSSANRPVNDIKKTVMVMAESVQFISTNIKELQETSNKILNVLRGNVLGEVSDLMPNQTSAAGASVPYNMEKTESGILLPTSKSAGVKEVKKQPATETVKKKKTSKPAPITAVSKKQSEKSQTLKERMVSVLGLIYPQISDIFSNSSPKPKRSTNSLQPMSNNVASDGLQPALTGIAKNQPVTSTIEPDELQLLLKHALKTAIEEIKKEDPTFFNDGSSGGSGLGDVLGSALGSMIGGRNNKRKPTPRTPKTATKAAGKTIFKSALKKLPIIGAVAGLGFAASRAMSGDWSGAAMEAGSGLVGTLPGLGTAASIGIDAALAAKDAGLIGSGAAIVPPKPQTALSSAVPTSTGAEIIDMNRRIQSGEVAVRTAPPGPPVVQRIVNNTVLPQKTDKENIRVGNSENTFNRLIEQDFNHPSTYSTFNMG